MFKALLNALKNLFSPPSTQGYPATPSHRHGASRGLILYDKELCIFCLNCEKWSRGNKRQ